MFARRQAMDRIARSPALVADTADGTEVHVRGTVRSLDMVLRSPTTGRAVVAYAMRVTEPSLLDYVELVPFAIEHPTLGRILVDSAFADLALPEHRTATRHDRSWAAFCDERHLAHASTGIERPLLAGVEVSVLGTVARRATKLCLVGDSASPLLIVDED